jgi:O-antigen/teichoic acid export membrane protein
MSNIRRQSIISSVVIYFGFVLGFVNTYLYTKQGSFTEDQYGLVNTFIAIANIMFSFANLGVLSFVYKFYPFYKDNLTKKQNDLATWALLISTCGFVLVIIAGYVFKDLVVRKYVTNAPDLIKYYHWLFPFGFGLTVYSVIESYAWQEHKSVLTNFLREVLFRVFTTVLIVLFFMKVIPDFDLYIKLYALTYIVLAGVLLSYLIVTKRISFHFGISRVTRKFYKKIMALSAFVWSGGLVYNIASVFDTLVIASVLPKGMALVGVYSLAQNIASLIQAPQRGIVAASIAPLSRAWKDKDLVKISDIYKRSAINQLIFSVAMFCLIMLNFDDGIFTFSMKSSYTLALPVFLFIGLMRILDMGTGLNAQIIATSIYWKFEFFTGIILLAMALPLNYFLTKSLGIVGPAISNLIAFTIYNIIRCIFLWKKVKMQPFSIKSAYTILLGIALYITCYFLFRHYSGLTWIIVRSVTFILLYILGAVYLKLSPDVFHVLGAIKTRVKKVT